MQNLTFTNQPCSSCTNKLPSSHVEATASDAIFNILQKTSATIQPLHVALITFWLFKLLFSPETQKVNAERQQIIIIQKCHKCSYSPKWMIENFQCRFDIASKPYKGAMNWCLAHHFLVPVVHKYLSKYSLEEHVSAKSWCNLAMAFCKDFREGSRFLEFCWMEWPWALQSSCKIMTTQGWDQATLKYVLKNWSDVKYLTPSKDKFQVGAAF